MSLRACSVCTLICEDNTQEFCAACESVLPRTDCSGLGAVAAESIDVPSSSDSEIDSTRQCAQDRDVKIPRLDGYDSVKGVPASSPADNVGSLDRAGIIAAHYAAAQRRVCESGIKGQEVHDLVLDEETVTFRIQGCAGDFNMFLSETYPVGESHVYGPDEWELSMAGTLEEILQVVAEDIRIRLGKRCSSPIKTLEAEPCSPLLQNGETYSDDSQPEIMEDIRMEPSLRHDVDQVIQLLGVDAVSYTQRVDTWRFRLSVDLFDRSGPQARALLDTTTARAWGVAADKPIVLEAQLPVKNYMKKESMPARIVTSSWQEGFDKFQLEKQLLQVIADFCEVVVQGSRCCGQASDVAELEQTDVLTHYATKKTHLISAARSNTDAGLLVHIVNYLRLRLETVHEYCAICDQPFTVPPMFLRTVCTRQLCAYQFVEFGERITTAEGVNSHAEIADLLVCMFVRAVLSPRHELIVDPYPSVCADRKSKELCFNPKQKDFKKLEKTISAILKIRNANAPTLGAAWTSVTTQMTKEGQALIQWIVASNRSYLLPLQENEAIKSFKTPFQYLLISAPPDLERKFQTLKAEHGSIFAFHGSSTENWHSILRRGLKNCSNTKYMTTGAVYGPGIYLAPNSSTALGYSMRGVTVTTGDSNAIQKTGKPILNVGNRVLENVETLFMLAVCEVINHSSLQKHNNSLIWVMPNEDMVITRFFIVFVQSNVGSNISITGLDGQIRACMEKLNVGSPGNSKPLVKT